MFRVKFGTHTEESFGFAMERFSIVTALGFFLEVESSNEVFKRGGG